MTLIAFLGQLKAVFICWYRMWFYLFMVCVFTSFHWPIFKFWHSCTLLSYSYRWLCSCSFRLNPTALQTVLRDALFSLTKCSCSYFWQCAITYWIPTMWFWMLWWIQFWVTTLASLWKTALISCCVAWLSWLEEASCCKGTVSYDYKSWFLFAFSSLSEHSYS